MWLKKIRCHKLQFFLIGLVLFVAAALLSLCLCFSAELSAFSKQAINRYNCPDAYILSVGTQSFADHFTDDHWKEEVAGVSALTGKTVTAPVRYQGNDITQLYDMALSADRYQYFGYLTLQAGIIEPEGPGKGQVWLSETQTSPNRIQLGDTVSLRYDTPIDLTVTGIYRSTCFPKAIGLSTGAAKASGRSSFSLFVRTQLVNRDVSLQRFAGNIYGKIQPVTKRKQPFTQLRFYRLHVSVIVIDKNQ